MLSVVVYDIPAISIHAPASGATDNRIRELALSIISIHAPASGATASDVAVLTGGTDFNPRSREWSDAEGTLEDGAVGISIHAPASGATAFIDIFSFTVRLYFISSH